MPIANLRPGGIGAQNGWILGAGADKVVAVDPLATMVHDDFNTYIRERAAGNPEQSFTILASSIPSPLVSVVRVKIGARARYDGGAGPKLQFIHRMGGNTSTCTPFVVAAGWAEYIVEMTRPGGGSWTPTDITSSGLTFAVLLESGNGSDDMNVTSLWIELEYTSILGAIQGFREVASRDLRYRRLPSGLIEVRWPGLDALDSELLDLANLSHPDLPSADGRGAGVRPWERWPVVILDSRPEWAAGETVLICRDVRDYLCTWWDTGKSLKASTEYADGIARLDAGNSRTWLRSTKKWVRTPGDKLVQVGIDNDANDKDGELFESESTNEVIESGFKNGGGDVFTGWSKSGEGSFGSGIQGATSEQLWDQPTTSVTRSMKFVAGNPTIHVADLYAQSTATASILANTVCRASIWHKDLPTSNGPNGSPLYYAIQRGFDSQWWRDSDQTWQAALTWNPMTVSTARARHKTKQMNVGANATTLTVRVGIPTANGVAGQENHAFSVQIEKKNFVSSAILTETTTVSRSADKLTISNGSNAPAWPPERGTFRCKVQPNWSAADVTAENKTVVYVEHDASNYDWLYFDGANARWVYERKAAGVVYRATKSHSPVAGTVYTLAARWTSSLGEWGWPAYTLSVFVWEDES